MERKVIVAQKELWEEMKIIPAHCRILFLCAFSIFLMSCLNWILEKPSFVLRGVILSPRSFTEMNLLIGLDVQNPNRFDLTLKSFQCSIYLKNEEIGKGRLENELLIPSSSTARIQVPIDVKFKDLGGSLKTFFTGGDLPYKIEGKADVRTVFGSLHFTFSKEGSTHSISEESLSLTGQKEE
ncbi:MAG: LEA type 2 family protein [Deltaproteobacteria bacterium]|nr:LEA type 2 family protein [Deltaproteobacteria bacterium]